jgi:hypothetical protein
VTGDNAIALLEGTDVRLVRSSVEGVSSESKGSLTLVTGHEC